MNSRLSIILPEGGWPISRSELIAHHLATTDRVADWSNFTGLHIVDAFHGLYHEGRSYIGLYQFRHSLSKHDIDPLVAISSYAAQNCEYHFGMVIPDLGQTVSFQHSLLTGESLVNESKPMLNYFAIECDRMEHYKSIKLSREQAHDIICRTVAASITPSGQIIELVKIWSGHPFSYLAPRTLWSLFNLHAFLLNRLRAPEVISRTKNLHEFFDEIAKFTPKTTTLIQDRFA